MFSELSTEREKWAFATVVAGLFFLFGNPLIYRLTGSIVGDNGTLEWKGVLLHTLVVFLVARAVLLIPSKDPGFD